MKKAFVLPLFLVLAALLFAQAQQSAQPKPLVFTHVTVIDATGAPAKHEMTVVITGSRITELGPTKRVRVPKDAQVVDATGKCLIKGRFPQGAKMPRPARRQLNSQVRQLIYHLPHQQRGAGMRGFKLRYGFLQSLPEPTIGLGVVLCPLQYLPDVAGQALQHLPLLAIDRSALLEFNV